MEHFKTIKNYLTLSNRFTNRNDTKNFNVKSSSKIFETNDLKTVEIVTTTTTNEKNVDNGRLRSKLIDDSSNENEKIPNEERKKPLERPKFLRSKSIEEAYSSLKNKTRSIIESTISEDFNSSIQGNDLFIALKTDLEKLIDHFKPYSKKNDDQSPSIPDTADYSNVLDLTDSSSINYYKLAQYTKEVLNRCIVLYNKIDDKCALYDYEDLKSNGYRSLLAVFDNCCRRMLSVVAELNGKKNGFFFNISSTVTNNSIFKELQAWTKLMEKLEITLQIAIVMQTLTTEDNSNEETCSNSSSSSYAPNVKFHDGPSLFVNSKQMTETSIEMNLFQLASVHQEDFFGRVCGFQFCDSLELPLTGVVVALASYNDGYEAKASNNKENQQIGAINPVYSPDCTDQNSPFGYTNFSPPYGTTNNSYGSLSPQVTQPVQASFFRSVYSGTKYVLDPELRAKKISHVMKDANVDFCKAFWQLTETSIAHVI